MDRHQIQQKDAQTETAYQFLRGHHHSLCSFNLGRASEWNWIGKWVVDICSDHRQIQSSTVKTDNGAVQRRNLQAATEPAELLEQHQLQPEGPPLPLTSSPPSAPRPSRRHSSTVQKLKDPNWKLCSSLQSSPHRAVQVTSRGQEVSVPLRYRDSWTLTDTHLHTVSYFLST